MKRQIAWIMALLLLLNMAVGYAEAPSPQEERDMLIAQLEPTYNMLQPITVLGSEQPEGSGVTLISPEKATDYPHITLRKTQSSIVLRGWAPTDLSLYAAGGSVTLEARATGDNARMEIGFEESIGGRSVSYLQPVNQMIPREWTTIIVPLSHILSETECCMSSVRQLLLRGENVQVRNIVIASPDKERSYPAFKVDQLGFKPDAEKIALVTGYPESLAVYAGNTYQLIDAETGDVVHTGSLTMVRAHDLSYSGEQILQADFTAFTGEGRYFLRAEGIADSTAFTIGENVYDELLASTLRYFYYQRANTPITAEYGQGFTRADMTPKDFAAPLDYDRSITVDVSGGWYDAGDVGKYVSPGATAANTLLWTYLLFPDCFPDGQSNIPESGNGVPDILDEVRYELDFLLKMQDSQSGGFYIKVKSRSENDGDGDRTVWVGDGSRCITNATADCTAVLAFASTIFRPFDAGYADRLLTAAERGWAYIEQNPNVYVVTNYSGENNASSAFWASAAVYYASGNESAHQWFLANYPNHFSSLAMSGNGHNVGNMGIYGYYTYLLCEEQDENAVKQIVKRYGHWKRSVVNRWKANPWKIAIGPTSFWWGSFNIILGNAQDLYIGEALLGNDPATAQQISQDAVHFILGRNAVRKCFITGMGEDPIHCTFSNIWFGDAPEGVPAGYMPGGVNAYNGGIISRFPLKCYFDSSMDWFTNENAVYWNAVMVFNAAAAVSQ